MNLGLLDERIAMAFIPDTDCLPEGISVPDSLVLIKSDAANKINVLVVNEASHNIQLDMNTYLENNHANHTIASKESVCHK